MLAKKKRDAAAAQDAVNACEQALAVFTEAKASYYISVATQDLTRARALLAPLTAEKDGMQGPLALAGGVGGERP
ncbi:putative translin family RNA/ssDNA-binding protein [Azospirillum fermentarium]|uniref:hypothetical protein n=1 Tax=Azospirillum fermentarium TaxID=1233114 RepID=UPI002225D4B0|nr:hypothetical protein [Azospirillum fermentarium]MCW2244990.1 putative translin family RNA/ssDNA-binding protein [Azospirillum fermentarium]